jgi:hypothetical protein
VHRFHPIARDAGVARVSRITVAVVAASTAATLGLGAAIATAAPPPKTKEKTDFADDKSGPATPPTEAGKGSGEGTDDQPQAPQDRPESSSGDEQTTSGGS